MQECIVAFNWNCVRYVQQAICWSSERVIELHNAFENADFSKCSRSNWRTSVAHWHSRYENETEKKQTFQCSTAKFDSSCHRNLLDLHAIIINLESLIWSKLTFQNANCTRRTKLITILTENRRLLFFSLFRNNLIIYTINWRKKN